MKAIHNPELTALDDNDVGNYKLKYNFESNSQPESQVPDRNTGWEL